MLGPEEVTSALVHGQGVGSAEIHEKAGIIPQTIFYLFDQVNTGIRNSIEYTIKCSYLEIYNESINDLLSNPPAHNLRIREFPRLGMCVIGSVEKVVTCPEDVFSCLALGTMNRITTATELNQRSSRSHTLFIVSVEQKMLSGSSKSAKINLVDLAGSEKVGKTGATGQALKEAQNINLSLTTLGRCIKALSARKEEHIPFRESKLTMILKEALGGNAKTSLICTVSQKIVHCEESKGTLKFAERAKKVQTKAKSNVKRSHEELLAIIDELNAEILALRKQAKKLGTPGDASTSRKSSISLDDEIYLKYADLKAQFDSLVETSQFENEKLKSDIEQMTENSERSANLIQLHLEKIEELKQNLTAVESQKEKLRLEHETDVLDVKMRVDVSNRELEILRKELKAATEKLASTNQNFSEKEEELDQAHQQIKMYEDLIKSNSEKNTGFKELMAMKGTQIESLNREIHELRAKLTKVSENEVILQSNLSHVTREKDEKDCSLTLSTRQIAYLQSEVKELSSKLSNSEIEVSSLRESEKRTSIDYQMEVFSLTQQLEEAKRCATTATAIKQEGSKAALHAKQMLSLVMKEMTDLQTMYQSAQIRFKQELLKVRESGEEAAHALEQQIVELTRKLDAEVTKSSELSKSLKLAIVEEDSLKFYMGRTKGEITNLTHELNKEKELCQTFQNELRETLAKLEHYKKLEEVEISGTEEEIAQARKQWKAMERTYKSSIDEITAQLLRLTAENAGLNDALTTKEAEVRNHIKRENALNTQVSVLTLRVQYFMKFFKQRNHSSITPNLAANVTGFGKIGKIRGNSVFAISSDSRKSSEEKEGSPSKARLTWGLHHQDLYGLQDIQSLYSNDEESEGSVRCKYSSSEASSDEEKAGIDVLE